MSTIVENGDIQKQEPWITTDTFGKLLKLDYQRLGVKIEGDTPPSTCRGRIKMMGSRNWTVWLATEWRLGACHLYVQCYFSYCPEGPSGFILVQFVLLLLIVITHAFPNYFFWKSSELNGDLCSGTVGGVILLCKRVDFILIENTTSFHLFINFTCLNSRVLDLLLPCKECDWAHIYIIYVVFCDE